MPAVTVTQARDEILARFKEAIDDSSYESIVVVYDGVATDHQEAEEDDTPPVPPGKPYLRVGVRHDDGQQASLGTTNGKRRQEMFGLFFAQVFTPFGQGNTMSDELVEVIMDAYRTGGATDSGVQFSRVRFKEVGKSRKWWQVNVLVSFQYDQIR